MKFGLRMKLTTLLLLTTLIGLQANDSYSQRSKITLKAENSSIAAIIDEIEVTTDFRFVYSNKQVDVSRKVSINVKKVSITNVLKILFSKTSTQYNIKDKQIILFDKPRKKKSDPPNKQTAAVAAPINITGKVTDRNGNGLPGMTVYVTNERPTGEVLSQNDFLNGTITDIDGNFSLEVEPGRYLVVSGIGYRYQVKEITSAQTVYEFALEEDILSLSEIIVTAQGIEKSKEALGYGIARISGEEVQGKAESDVGRSLFGKIAGVQLTESSGSTGNTPSIRVRSSLSITQGNAPLIVVDNVPFAGSLIDIDPNDIKEITVLKSLNASVLYGSAGRNGVILIQTKSGSKGKGKENTTINFSQTFYTNTLANLPEFQNTYGQGADGTFSSSIGNWGPAFAELDSVPHPYAGQADIFPEFATVNVPYVPATNNVEDFFETGTGSVTALNITTSQEKTSFNVSIGYTEESGIIGNNDLERFNLSVGGQAQVTNKLNVSATMSYMTRERNSQSGTDIFERLLYLPRNLDLKNLPFQNPQTGENVYYRGDTNPLWTINNTGRNDNIVRLFTTLNVGYQLTDNLNISYRLGYNNETEDEEDFTNIVSLSGEGDELGELELDFNRDILLDQSIIIGSDYQLTEKIGFTSQVGINSRIDKFRSNSSESREQIVFGFNRPDNFNVTTAEASRTRRNLAGVFGQFEFSYDQYLYLTLSGRNDWGSTVEPENRSLFYPGVAVSFIPTSAFNLGSSVIDNLKIRGAYATSSGFPGAFNTRESLELDPQEFIKRDGTAVVANSVRLRLPNPDLKPELHKEFELGVEGNFFQGRVNLDVSVYKRISEDQILERALDRSTGFSNILTNVGRVDTDGVEIDLGVNVVRTGDFTWNIRNLFTAFETEVVDLGGTIDRISLDDDDDDEDRVAVQGQPLGVLWGSFAMRDPQGNFLINPTNGELITSEAVGLQNRVIANPTPDWRLTNIP